MLTAIRDLIRDSPHPLQGGKDEDGVPRPRVGRDLEEDPPVVRGVNPLHAHGRSHRVPGHVGEPRGLLVENQVAAVDGEAAPVSEAEQLLVKALREPVLPNERVQHEAAEGLRQELLDGLIVEGARHELAPPEEEARGHQAVQVGIPLGLASECLDRRDHARDSVSPVENGAKTATNGLERTAGEEAEEPPLPQE